MQLRETKNMRRRVRLTESQLRDIVEEASLRILQEAGVAKAVGRGLKLMAPGVTKTGAKLASDMTRTGLEFMAPGATSMTKTGAKLASNMARTNLANIADKALNVASYAPAMVGGQGATDTYAPSGGFYGNPVNGTQPLGSLIAAPFTGQYASNAPYPSNIDPMMMLRLQQGGY